MKENNWEGMTNLKETIYYCESCGETRPEGKAIKKYCPKHLAENTKLPDLKETIIKEFEENFPWDLGIAKPTIKSFLLEALKRIEEAAYEEGKEENVQAEVFRFLGAHKMSTDQVRAEEQSRIIKILEGMPIYTKVFSPEIELINIREAIKKIRKEYEK